MLNCDVLISTMDSVKLKVVYVSKILTHARHHSEFFERDFDFLSIFN